MLDQGDSAERKRALLENSVATITYLSAAEIRAHPRWHMARDTFLRLTVEGGDGSVHVTNRTRLLSWIEGRPHVLSDDEVEVIDDTARQPATWGMEAVAHGARRLY